MAEPIRDSSALQKQLSEFQDVQRQLQMISAQRQQMLLQLEEVKMAEEEISKSDKGIYRSIGPLLVESSKSDANADLKERKELFEMRLSVLDKQEAKLKPRFTELRDALEKALSQAKAK
jgi:prefoldin beta subunit